MKTYVVDSFTGEQFKGNPAGVCFPDKPLDEHKMLQIAAELGFSETAYVIPTGKENKYTIRYFSPKLEIPLCGHATLASAKVIFKENDVEKIHFITVGNLNLVITKQGEEITMEFPVYETEQTDIPPSMLSALGLKSVVNSVFSTNNNTILLEIDDSEMLKNLKPDFNALVASYKGIHGVLVTAPSLNNGYDYHYRFFWPWAGTNEDPVTGGVQTFLAKYWSKKLHKKKMMAFQSSERTGYMGVQLENDKVLLTSRAVVIMEGKLLTN